MVQLFSKARAFLRDVRANASAEFVLAVPLMVLFSFGVFDMGRMWWLSSTLEHSAHEGTRFASVRGATSPSPASETDVATYVRNRAVGIDPSALEVAVSWDPDNNSGSSVTVLVGYDFDYVLAGFIPALGPSELAKSSTMVIP